MIIDKFEILDKIGEGAFGEVFKAKNQISGKILALKVIKGNSDVQLDSFLKEARKMNKLEPAHLNVIKMIDADIRDGLLLIQMEYFEGITLQKMLEKKGTLDDGLIVEYIRQILDGLSFIHSRRLVHRDIKPDNILLNKDFSLVKISDFGISKDLDYSSSDSIQGAYLYMSPEQLTDPKNIDHRSDFYSLAVVIYQLKTGLIPFYGSITSVIDGKRFGEIPKTDSFLDSIIQKATKKNPKDRYQSAEEFKMALIVAYEKSKRKKSFASLYWFLIITLIGVLIYNYRSVLMPAAAPAEVDVSKEEKIEQILPNSPETVNMGNQVWMSKNLNTRVFRNGDSITEAKTKEEWNQLCKEKKPAFYYPDFNQQNAEKYGLLYNWYAAIDERNLSPDGFGIPGKKDFDYLISNFKLNELSSDLIRIFPGYRDQIGYYPEFDSTSIFWSKDEKYPGCQFTLTASIKVKSGKVKIGEQKPCDGYSVRCIKE